MAKLSIPKTLKQISTIGLFTATPLLASGQLRDSTVTMTRSQWDSLDQARETYRQKIADSIYQLLVPKLVEYYTPKSYHSKKIAKICYKTQQTLQNAVLARQLYSTLNGEYIESKKRKLPDSIYLNSILEDKGQIRETLTHEGFHVERWDMINENVKAYNDLPIKSMQEAYRQQEVLESLKMYKKFCGKYDEQMYYEKSTPSSDNDYEVTRVYCVLGDSAHIAKIDMWIEKIQKGDFNFDAEDIGEIGDHFSDAHRYVTYLTTRHEMYARSRVLESYVKDLYGINKSDITLDHITKLREESSYKDQNFLQLIAGFEEQFLVYLNTIEPK